MKSLRHYRRTHGIRTPLLEELRQHVRENGAPGAADVRELAERLGQPAAAVRGALSFYEDLSAPPEETQVCNGTSCAFARGAAAGGQTGEGRPVYCLGHCDRSPVALRVDGELVFGAAGEQSAEASLLPAVRSAAAEPIVTRRLLRGDFSAYEKARADGAYRALEGALAAGAEAVLTAVEGSGHRGRGGAGFPTGTKWRACAAAADAERFVVANGDEGDPGSFIDRVLMEFDPHGVLEGLLLCGYAAGAQKGVVFIRSEYPHAAERMQAAIDDARAAGVLGAAVLGARFAFDVEVVRGRGSYVCGEETAMLNAIEGVRGEVRLRPPYPSDEGLYGQPTVVNNVETLVNIPVIVERGAAAYQALGTAASAGTKALCLNRGFGRPGIVEVEFGVSLRWAIEEAGGGADGEPLAGVILGGPMGSILAPDEWDVPICYGAMGERGIQLGHGGLVALPEAADMRRLLGHWLEFMMAESCGKCVPCRLGSRRAWSLLNGETNGNARRELERVFEVLEQASLCAFGQAMPGPMRQLLTHFGDRIFPGGGPA